MDPDLDLPSTFGLRSHPGRVFRALASKMCVDHDVCRRDAALAGACAASGIVLAYHGTYNDGGDWYMWQPFGPLPVDTLRAEITHDPNLDMPEGLDEDGVLAWKTIMAALPQEAGVTDCPTGGCTAFYSPAKWRERREAYGLTSVMIVCYDGGELRPHFNMDEGDYKAIDAMQAALGKVGMYAEECTGWYAAIYRK